MIARTALIAFQAVILSTMCVTMARAATIHGRVVRADGSPVSDAMVSIPEAGPVVGVGVICKSCYVECAKRVLSERDGSFTIRGLGDSLVYRLLVTQRASAPWLSDRVHADGDPVTARLQPRDLAHVADSLVVRGRLIDPLGAPIARATIKPVGFRAGRRRDFGNVSLDPLAVTDEDGRFELLVGHEPLAAVASLPATADSARVWFLEVEARGFAPFVAAEVATGTRSNEWSLQRGSALVGRATRAGVPLAGVVIGVIARDRGAVHFTGEQRVATDENGRFRFDNLSPNQDAVLYGSMTSFTPYGGAPALPVHTASDESTLVAPDLHPSTGRRLAGRLRFSDGGAPPTGTRVLLTRDMAWDLVTMTTDSLGRFEFDSVPEETVHISVGSRDHHLAEGTPGIDRWLQRVTLPAAGPLPELELRLVANAPGTSAAVHRDTTRVGAPRP